MVANQQASATPEHTDYARRWHAMPRWCSPPRSARTTGTTRLATGDAVAEITRLKAEDGDSTDIGGTTLAAAATRDGLIDEYVLATAPVLVGSGTPFFTASWGAKRCSNGPDLRIKLLQFLLVDQAAEYLSALLPRNLALG
jgi:hypothetical protein